jgi:hypothetical protein
MPTDEHRAWVRIALGVTGGGASAAKTGSKAKVASRGKKKVTTIEMEEEVIEVSVATGLPGDTGEQMIKDQLGKMQTYISDYWSNYANGITKFTNKMSFASEAEAEAKYLQVTFTAVAKAALDYAIDEAGEKLGGPWGEILSAAKDVAEAWMAESERAGAAAGEVKVVKYINDLIDGIAKQRDGMRAVVEKGTRPLIEEYQRLAKSDNLKGKATPDGRVIGEAANIVKGVQAGVEAFRKATPSAGEFQQRFTRAFADTPGLTDYISHGGREARKLYFAVSLYMETDSSGKHKWSVEDIDSAWTLATKQEHPDRVAESLMETAPNGEPWRIDLEKKVKISVEVEKDWALNSYPEGWIVFTKSPDKYEVRALVVDAGLSKFMKEAWDYVRPKVLGVKKLVGTNE